MGNKFYLFCLSGKRGTGGGKLSYQGALLLRTKKPEDRQVRIHLNQNKTQIILAKLQPFFL